MADDQLTTYTELAEVIENLPLLVRETRRSRGLSGRAAAKQAGMNFTTLSRVEHGEDMRASSLQAILRWLDRAADAEAKA